MARLFYEVAKRRERVWANDISVIALRDVRHFRTLP